ncbi:YidC/Oxa1 family membrane protein insertase [Candidatus Daviesbacteria bacterium]|nr:YidC/Oxa1 family membrane protein insertase [Candidatus Daviesbacteria bacterium]
MNIGDLFNLIFMGPIINVLAFVLNALNSIGLPGALGFSLILLTVLIRLLAWPLMTTQLKSAKKMADLKPHLDELKKKHSDKQELARAQMVLYKEHGVNPAAGCLPALLQVPVFLALYQVIINVLPGKEGSIDFLNSLLYLPTLKFPANIDVNFFGLNLGAKPAEFASYGWYLLAVPAVTALLTFIQSKMTLVKPVKHYPSDSPKEAKEKEGLEESMAQMQSQMVFLMPIMIGYFAFTFPIGLAIYWNTYTILGILQQYLVSGWGGMSDIMKRLGVPEVQLAKSKKNKK